MAIARYAEKFTSSDGSTLSYSFPLNLYEWDAGAQGLEVPVSALAGASYDYNQLASSVSPKRNAVESVRFLKYSSTVANMASELDNARSKCQRIGLGKLWTLDSGGTRRWAWARLASMPSWTVTDPFQIPVSVSFLRFSDWYSDTAFTDASNPYSIAASPTTFTVNNAGDARVFNAILTLKGTFTNPMITNTTNGYRLQSTRDGAASSDWLRFDAGKNRVEFSSDGGANYAGDLVNFVRKAGQVQLMVLEPGDNDFSVSDDGSPSASLLFTFYPAYHA